MSLSGHRTLTAAAWAGLWVIAAWVGIAAAERGATEQYHQVRWCEAHHGITEVALDDGTRVDCLTDTYAIEFDFARKWAEAVGQAAHYAAMTGHAPGVVLILEGPDDLRFVDRILSATRDHLGDWRFWFIWEEREKP